MTKKFQEKSRVEVPEQVTGVDLSDNGQGVMFPEEHGVKEITPFHPLSTARELTPKELDRLARLLKLGEAGLDKLDRLVIPSREHLEELRKSPLLFPIIPGLLWPGAASTLIANSSDGKTVLAHRICRALSTGTPILDIELAQRFRCLHIDLESPEASKDMCLSHIEPAHGWLDTRTGILDRDARWLIELGLWDVVLLDNLVTIFDLTDENDNAEAVRWMNFLTGWAKRNGTSFMLLHNTGKSEHTSEIHSARGAQAWTDRSDAVLRIREVEAETFTLKVTKSRFGNKGETIKYRWTEDYDYEVLEHTFPQGNAQLLMTRRVRSLFHAPREAELKEIETALAIKDESERRLLGRVLHKMVKGEELYKPHHGAYGRR